MADPARVRGPPAQRNPAARAVDAAAVGADDAGGRLGLQRRWWCSTTTSASRPPARKGAPGANGWSPPYA